MFVDRLKTHTNLHNGNLGDSNTSECPQRSSAVKIIIKLKKNQFIIVLSCYFRSLVISTGIFPAGNLGSSLLVNFVMIKPFKYFVFVLAMV